MRVERQRRHDGCECYGALNIPDAAYTACEVAEADLLGGGRTLASGADHAAAGRAGSDENLDGIASLQPLGRAPGADQSRETPVYDANGRYQGWWASRLVATATVNSL